MSISGMISINHIDVTKLRKIYDTRPIGHKVFMGFTRKAGQLVESSKPYLRPHANSRQLEELREYFEPIVDDIFRSYEQGAKFKSGHTLVSENGDLVIVVDHIFCDVELTPAQAERLVANVAPTPRYFQNLGLLNLAKSSAQKVGNQLWLAYYFDHVEV